MISWEEYIKTNILEFRRLYEKLSEEEKKVLEEDRPNWMEYLTPLTSLNKVCQVVVIDFSQPFPKCFIVLHSKEHPDMRTIVFENADFKSFLTKALREPRLLEVLHKEDVMRFNALMKGRFENDVEFTATLGFWSHGHPGWILKMTPRSFLVAFNKDPRSSQYRFVLADMIQGEIKYALSQFFRKNQTMKIEKTVSDIKKSAELIQELELRRGMLGTIENLEDEISQLHKKIDEEIGGVRKMIGTTKEFQDFRVFTTDVEDLKKSHVHREVFESEIRRLDQKIDGLKDIKLWSKRTIVDIVLTIVATVTTAIVTLLATGVLKF